MALLSLSTDADKVAALRAQVSLCGSSPCGNVGADTVCSGGAHLRPDALSARYPALTTATGKYTHLDAACPKAAWTSTRQTMAWSSLVRSACPACFVEPAAVTRATADARRVGGALRTITAATDTWPGRLSAADRDAVTAARKRLSTHRGAFSDLAALATAVADLLLLGTDAWTPPDLPAAVLGAAVVALVGVDTAPFFATGHRPVSVHDRAAAAVSSNDRLSRLWDHFVSETSRRGLAPDAERTAASWSGSRPASKAALHALLADWDAQCRALLTGPAVVVAVPGTVSNPHRPNAAQSAVASLLGLAALTLPGRTASLLVVPPVVADWLARADLPLYELIGAWPGPDGVAILEVLVKLADGDVHRMPDLLDVATDLARTST